MVFLEINIQHQSSSDSKLNQSILWEFMGIYGNLWGYFREGRINNTPFR